MINYNLLTHPFVSQTQKDNYTAVNNPANNEILAYVYNITEEELEKKYFTSSNGKKRMVKSFSIAKS
ncbi:hypothetical protein AB9T38_06715 [Campylobacter hepaticus]